MNKSTVKKVETKTLSIASLAYVGILQAELKKRTKKNSKYSLRQFASDLDLDAGSLSRVLAGTRALSHAQALKIIPFLKLDSAMKKVFLRAVEESSDIQNKKLPSRAAAPSAKAIEKYSAQENAKNEKIRLARAKIDRSVVKDYRNKILFVTTVVEGASVNKGALRSVETFLKAKNADLILLTSKAHMKALKEETYPLDDEILDSYSDCVYKHVSVNNYLSLINIDARPSVTDPLSGLAELGAEDGRSYIVAHTTQRMKTYPNGNTHLPRLQQCTGAITEPQYLDNKAGLLADKRHVMGGIVIEIAKDCFHVRQVQFAEDGSFVDLGSRFNPEGNVDFVRPEALIRGDDHVGFGDVKCNIALDEVTAALRPKKIIVHDLMDSASISHHREHSMSARLGVPEHMNTLKKEMKGCTEFLVRLNAIKPKDSEIFIIPANHNEHLHKWLDECRYVKDHVENYKTGVELAYQYHVLKKDPLVYGVDPEQKLATWLKRGGETLRVAGVAFSSHGDKGPNGSRGSVRGDAVSYGKNTSGHSHSPETYRGANRVGTSSVLDMDYTTGSPSSWAHCFELIFLGKDKTTAHRQLVIVIDGKWKLDESKAKVTKSKK